MSWNDDIFGWKPWEEDGEEQDPLEAHMDRDAMRHVPLEIRQRLRPEWQHWGVVAEELWPHYQRSNECRKIFLETAKGIVELDDLHSTPRGVGDRVWCLVRRRPRGGGGTGFRRRPPLTLDGWLARNPRLVIDWGGEQPAPMRRFALEVLVLHLPGEWRGEEWTWRLDAWGGHLPHVRQVGGTAAEGEWAHVARFDGLESVARHTLTVQRGSRAVTLINHLDEDGLRRAGAVRQPGVADPPLWLLRHEVRGDTVVLTVSPRPPRFGVFFDGTGNDLFRDLRDPHDEYEPTNVGKLHELYPHQAQGVVQKLYVRGIGTGPEGDSALDQGFAFSFGKRIARAVSELQRFLRRFPLCPVAEVDVFGFSRGAAQARAFVNEVVRLGREEPGRWGGPVPRFSFLGLFDTVGSVGVPGDEDNDNWKSNDGLDGSIVLDVAPEAVARAHHITAEDEVRRYFPLSSLRGPDGGLPGHFSEEGLPGAHADIGGGYGPVPTVVHLGDRVLLWYTWAEREAARAEAEAELRRRYPHPGLEVNHETRAREAVPPGQERALRMMPGLKVPPPPGVPGVRLQAEQVHFYWRREVKPDYACLALQRMHAVAVEAGVPLAEVEALDDKGLRWQVPREVPGWVEWVREKGRRGQVWEWLYTGYLHHSHQYAPAPGQLLNPHEPEPSGRRTVYPNRPDRARQAWARAPVERATEEA